MVFWTAGQRIDPSTGSTIVWRVTSTDTFSDSVSVITYGNWHPGEPNHGYGKEACMHVSSGISYRWNDAQCSEKKCSICELDI